MDADKIGKKTRAPNRGGGRPKGVKNKTTIALKEAILLAAEQTGQDGQGKGGLAGFLKHMIATDLKAFASLLGKLIPTNIVADITTRQAQATDQIMTPDEWANQHNQDRTTAH